ncbi:MAG: hypothetical protein EOP54_06295 [Sphingobacteriales bacterium]|nr:MAG: hypothetical protein EOP54_06295 [Sphingobacteriales bacterium]
MTSHKEESLQVLADIKSIMDRSSRVLSLSGWSGIWAGLVALAAAGIAGQRFSDVPFPGGKERVALAGELLILALLNLVVAISGAFYFSYRKNKKQGQVTFNAAARKMIISMGIPMLAGGWMCGAFILNADFAYVVPVMLITYGLTLINSSKYTISAIRWLGLFEVLTGCIAFLKPEWQLYFWAFGFGVLHIIYGFIMWNKYDRKGA